jgi:peroxiredoxin
MMGNRLQVGDRAPDSVVLDLDGNDVYLSQLWQDGPVLLTFLRHFGCMFCREWLGELEDYQDDIRRMGLKIYSVGIGEPKHAERYCGRLTPNTECFSNEDASAYYEYGFGQMGLKELLNLDFVRNTLRALANGNIQTEMTGDGRMIGGHFIIDQDGIIRYAFYSETAGDHPTFGEILHHARMLHA